MNKAISYYNENKVLVWMIGIGTLLLSIGLINRKKINDMLTKYSNKAKFALLNPIAKTVFNKFFLEVKKIGWSPIITSSWRSYARELSLTASNTQNGNAKNSPHLYGIALDLNFISDKTQNKVMMADGRAGWEATGIPQIARKLNLRWGGDFQNYNPPNGDPVHFDLVNILAAKGIPQKSLYDKAISQFGNPQAISGKDFIIKA